MNSPYLRRRITNALAMVLSTLATVIGLAFLAWILWETLRQGISALDLKLFTKVTAYGEDGGLLNSMVGSLVINFIGIGIATPIGVLAGTWLAEYANRTRLGESIRFLNDILLSAPSIVMGLFVYTIIVLPSTALTHGSTTFSGFAGGVALALIALPVIVRTTDEMLRLVPVHAARGGAVARRAAVEADPADPDPRGALGHHHRRAAGAGANQRRNCAAAVHGVRQQLHGDQPDGQDVQPAADHLPVRQRPGRRDACPGLGRRVRDHHVRAVAEPGLPPDPFPQQGVP